MNRKTLRFKISLLYTWILAGILIFYAGAVFLTVEGYQVKREDTLLEEKAERIRMTALGYCQELNDTDAFDFAFKRISGADAEHENAASIEDKELNWMRAHDLLGISGDYLIFLKKDGSLISHTENVNDDLYSALTEDLAELQSGDTLFKFKKTSDSFVRLLARRVNCDPEHEYVIVVATPLTSFMSFMKKNVLMLLMPIPLLLLGGFFLGRVFASRILQPVRELTKAANNITHEDLSSRVRIEERDEELAYLTDAFNNMIARLEKSFAHANELSSQIAHEMKTPLAIISGETELCLRKDRESDEYKRVIELCGEEAERMRKIMQDLLLLTRIDFRPDILNFEEYRVDEFLSEIIDAARIMAAGKSIKVEAEYEEVAGEKIRIDKTHLRRLFFNLIDNAIKYSSESSKVELRAEQEGDGILFKITDFGEGFSAEEAGKIFNKFYRINKHEQKIQGTGLGLSIVKSIAEAHAAKISVTSTPENGTTFTLNLPKQ